MRRYLFKLQKQKEEEFKSGDFSVMSIQRQQMQKMMESESKRKQEMYRDQSVRKESTNKSDEEISETTPNPVAEDENRLRGLRSLLMPPSVRRKLEAVASVNHSGNESEKREAAEAAARFYLLQTTRKTKGSDDIKANEGSSKNRNSYSNQAKVEQFTALEQEMHDMSEALSSYSLSEATISELNDLETY
ncbi:unnamed protein product [Trichobilharzia regenti]|nr:unnamed protein product [Trichobilharzia regenti]